MGGTSREGTSALGQKRRSRRSESIADWNMAGGKAKPLKAGKKEKKELDEDDLAFQAKQRAGEPPQSEMVLLHAQLCPPFLSMRPHHKRTSGRTSAEALNGQNGG